ncbi:ABC transporter ATP-binding protein [Arachidicoccus ginsenosidimutans]|uniref:ABC transporter ATP-binding protein n=1 Tax=Arachidicoccus sp. BS20 TaxID=1850526 RepID=UPI0007F133BD|nr:ATP-binding cassette domain-containing protein [Arachidicoccus sp. BS20]ANI89935.1 ABC transporter ATP-binding protein [Arachidicoccus sp. BS20]
MQITLTNSGKRFNRDWIFRGLDYSFISKKSYAITGSNGSGKSTLLQAICGAHNFNEGKCEWKENAIIPEEKIYKQFSIVTPYLELVEEMTAKEFLHFHNSFKPLLIGFSIEEIIGLVELPTSAVNKQIRYYSSGMKQRLKLAQAIFSNTPVLFLDEPCTNLDKNGYALYHKLIKNFCQEKLIIVSSNDEAEYNFCEEIISIQDYKIHS